MTRLLCGNTTLLLVFLLFISPAQVAGQTKSLPPGSKAVLWSAPPSNMSPSDWTWGPGGKAEAPVPPFEFVKEDISGSSPKVQVKDARSVTWVVKFGPEVHSDSFTPRLVYACGYIVLPTYYVPEGKISGAQHLKRARPFITRDGNFRYARFKLHSKNELARDDTYNWSWKANPFLGTHELNGLKILLMLTSNWDGKDSTDIDGGNTGVFIRKSDSSYDFLFTDWGATMGKWGNFFTRNKWDAHGYMRQSPRLVKSVMPNGDIKWGFSGKHKRDLTEGVGAADVRWLMRYLGRVTNEELQAGLIASGANAGQVQIFSAALRGRIEELQEAADASEARK